MFIMFNINVAYNVDKVVTWLLQPGHNLVDIVTETTSGRYLTLTRCWSSKDTPIGNNIIPNNISYQILHLTQFRVECVHLVCGGSNANTVVSCSKDGLIKYWNVKRYREKTLMIILIFLVGGASEHWKVTARSLTIFIETTPTS